MSGYWPGGALVVVDVVDVEVLVVDVDVLVLVVDDVVGEVVLGGRVVVVEDEVELVDDVVDETVVVTGGVSSLSDDRSAKMMSTAATATIRIASAQKIGLLNALLSVGGGPLATGTGSPPGGTAWAGSVSVGSVGVGSIVGIACVGSSAPGNAPVGSSPPAPGAPPAPLPSLGFDSPVPSFGVSLMTVHVLASGVGDAERSGPTESDKGMPEHEKSPKKPSETPHRRGEWCKADHSCS